MKPAINEWKPEEGRYAERFHISDLSGFKKTLKIQPGVEGLLYNKRGFQSKIAAQTHDLDSILGRLDRFGRNLDLYFVLYQSAFFDLNMAFRATSKDLVPIDIPCQIRVNINDGQAFERFFMVNSDTVEENQVKNKLLTLSSPLVNKFFIEHELESVLSSQKVINDELEGLLESQLSADLNDMGLGLRQVHIEGIDFAEAKQYAQLKSDWRDLDLQKDAFEQEEKRFELEKQKRLQRIKDEVLKNELKFKERDESLKQRLQDIENLEKVTNAENREAAIKADAEKTVLQMKQALQKERFVFSEQEKDWEAIKIKAAEKREHELTLAREALLEAYKIEQKQKEAKVKAAHDRLVHEARIREIEYEAELAELIDDKTAQQSEREKVQKKLDLEHELLLEKTNNQFRRDEGRKNRLTEYDNEKARLEHKLWATKKEGEIKISDAQSDSIIKDIEREIKKENAKQEHQEAMDGLDVLQRLQTIQALRKQGKTEDMIRLIQELKDVDNPIAADMIKDLLKKY